METLDNLLKPVVFPDLRRLRGNETPDELRVAVWAAFDCSRLEEFRPRPEIPSIVESLILAPHRGDPQCGELFIGPPPPPYALADPPVSMSSAPTEYPTLGLRIRPSEQPVSQPPVSETPVSETPASEPVPISSIESSPELSSSPSPPSRGAKRTRPPKKRSSSSDSEEDYWPQPPAEVPPPGEHPSGRPRRQVKSLYARW